MLRSLSVLVLSVSLSGAAAATTFRAGVSCNGPGQVSEGPAPVSEACSVSNQPLVGIVSSNGGSWDSFANASAGPSGLYLNAWNVLDVAGGTFGEQTVSASAEAVWTFDDFLVTGTGSASTPILGALHLWVDGQIYGGGYTDSQGPFTSFVNGIGEIYFEIEINGIYAGSGNAFYAFNDGNPIEQAFDLLSGHYGTGGAVSDSITSDQLLIPVGQTFDVRVRVVASTRAVVRILGTPADPSDTVTAGGSGLSNFQSTVSFAPSGPVFDLPPGYTVNSVSAGIVNNQLVPEPGVLWLLAGGTAGVFALRRRFSRAR